MGCLLSCICTSPNITFNTIRLLHLNGDVEDFDHPITASEVIGNPPRQFLFTAAQLIAFAASKPLDPDTELKPGHLYFVLPLSTLRYEISPLDMASVVKRLIARAKSVRSDQVSPKPNPSSSLNRVGSAVDSSVSRSIRRPERMEMMYGLRKSCGERAQPRKPILDTIFEIPVIYEERCIL